MLDLWPENLYSVLPVTERAAARASPRASATGSTAGADRLIAMSEPLQKRLCERTGKSAADVAVIPQYCEDFYAVPCPDETLASRFGGRFNLVFTGTFTPAQSLDTVIRAVAKARAAGAEELHLLLVGDGMSRADLETLVQELRAGSYVTFYGSVPARDVPRFTTLADALLISLSDSPDLGMTVPAKLASYMAAGKPVVASMDGAGADAVRAANCGMVSAACDADTLADNLVQLCRMPQDRRAEMGRCAKMYYLEHYRRSILLRRLEAFLLGGAPDTAAGFGRETPD